MAMLAVVTNFAIVSKSILINDFKCKNHDFDDDLIMIFAFKKRNEGTKHKEFCIKNKGFCILNDDFCRLDTRS